MSDTESQPRRSSRFRLLLIGVTVAGLLGFTLFPKIAFGLGISDYGRWFLDSYAILASNDAIAAGLDPYHANPLDDLHRPHSYSHWWFLLGKMGLTRADNFVFGGLCVLACLVVAFAGLRPRTMREVAWYATLMLCPPFLMAVNRANNDLVVFAVLGCGALALSRPTVGRWLTVLMAVAMATGLKFYPAVAAAGLLLVRPIKRFWLGLFVAGLGLLLISVNIWSDFGRAVIPVPSGVYSFGAPLLLNDLGWTGRSAQIGTAALLLVLGAIFQRRGLTVGLTENDSPIADRLRFIWAGVLLLVCFTVGISYAYRWIFVIWCAPWLWTVMTSEISSPARRRGAFLASALLLFGVWSDGLFCIVVNLFFIPVAQSVIDHWQLAWRMWTQPLVWLLMAMLTGWLLDAGLATLDALRTQPERK